MNQLYCTETGSAYPTSAINTYTDDNKALLRRMFGEAQLAPPAPEVTPAATVKIFSCSHIKYLITPKLSQVRIVSTLPLFTAAPLVTTQAFQVRREIFENQDTVQSSVLKKHLNVTSEVPA